MLVILACALGVILALRLTRHRLIKIRAAPKIVHGIRTNTVAEPPVLTWCGESWVHLPAGETIADPPFVTCPHCMAAEQLNYLIGGPKL